MGWDDTGIGRWHVLSTHPTRPEAVERLRDLKYPRKGQRGLQNEVRIRRRKAGYQIETFERPAWNKRKAT